MARVVAFALFVSLVAGLVPSAVRGADQTPEELIRNPGFDEDANGDELPDAWSVQRDRVRWREKVYLSKDYELVSQPGAYVLATQDVPLAAGHRYTLTLVAKGEDGAMAGALILYGPQKPTREMHALWHVKISGEYEKYVATFTAPEGVTRLYLYNCSREGTIYYDRVSLYEGEPTDPVISPLAWRPLDLPLEAPLVTPHTDWASPLPQGPIKTFITLRAYRCLRDVIELAQRIDLDYDLIHTGYDGEECISETNRRAMKRLDANEYQVYLVPSRVPAALAKAIEKRVSAGAGLVVVEGFGQASKYVNLKQLQTVDDDHYLRCGIPWEQMPEKILSAVQIGNLGQGRVVRLVFPSDVAKVWGLLPTETTMAAYQSRQFEYWEWWYSLLARAMMWAAGREGDVRLRAGAADAQGLTIAAQGVPAGSLARVTVRSGREIRFDGPPLRCPTREIPLKPDGSLTIPADPKLPAGTVIADVVLLNPAGEVLTWGSFTVDVPQAARISRIAADHEAYRPGNQVNLDVTLTAVKPSETQVEAKLIDAFGRIVSETRQALQVKPAEQAVKLSLAIRDPLCVHHRAFVRLIAAGREQDSAWLDVLCRRSDRNGRPKTLWPLHGRPA